MPTLPPTLRSFAPSTKTTDDRAMTILLLTGHENGGVRQQMADRIAHLGRVTVQNARRLRHGGSYDLIIFDTRVVKHPTENEVLRRYRGVPFVRTNTGTGGLARAVETALAGKVRQ